MVEIPSGTVTFLFTDVEGSTQLWEHQPALMQHAVARHDQLLRSCIEAHQGYVFKTVGDAFCAAFPAADAGLHAALDAQRAIHQEPWDPSCVVHVRMALHIGDPEERDNDYFGPPVNRVARLLSAGHGGQTLLSQKLLDALQTVMIDGVAFEDMGAHRLKDLVEPEHIFQLTAPDLAHDFAPLKVLDYQPTNLPIQSTAFVGRQRDLEAIADMTRREDVRLVTLVGPGGTGKTRLALQVGANLLDEFGDGVYVVDLSSVSDPALVLSTIAGSLHVHEAGGRPLEDLLIDHLRDKHMVLIVDNFEHLLDAATIIASLLAKCSRLTVLATSRAPLHLRGEREYPVVPLSVPDVAHLPPFEDLAQYDSVQLFVERAQAVKPGFSLSADNATAIAEICHRLDGLPLALELAAARVRMFPPSSLLTRLSSRLKVLTGGARDLPERQQTLRGAIDWSYSLLSEEEQHLFARLSVFSGGCTFEAAEAVCGAAGDLEVDVLDGMTSLVEKSLVRQDVREEEPRFTMLQTIREYAGESLEERGEVEELGALHAGFYQQLAHESEAGYHAADQASWLDTLETEHDNMRSALVWALQGPDDEQAVRLSASLQWFWYLHGHLTEGRRWLRQALERGEGSNSKARSHALNRGGALAFAQGDFADAQRLLDQGLATAREVGDQNCVAEALHELGKVAGFQGEYAQARERLEESLVVYRALKDIWSVGALVNELGVLAILQSDYTRGKPLLEEALAIARKLRQKRVIAIQLNNLAWVANRQSEPDRAKTLLDEALQIFRAVDDKWFIARALEELAIAVSDLHDYPSAASLLRESLVVLRELDDELGMAEWLEIHARLAARNGRDDRAVRLHGAGHAVRAELGSPLAPGEEAVLEQDLASVRAHLGDAWNSAWEAASNLTLEEALTMALQDA